MFWSAESFGDGLEPGCGSLNDLGKRHCSNTLQNRVSYLVSENLLSEGFLGIGMLMQQRCLCLASKPKLQMI